jgi:glycine cleavage system aminomethyltransferase T
MLHETEKKGEIARLHVELRAVERGFIISRPTTLARYDIIVDDGKSLKKYQIKYANGTVGAGSNAVRVGLRRRNSLSVNAKVRVYFKEEVDGILVYLPSIERIVLLGPDDFSGKKEVSIRTAPSKSGQIKGVTFAESRFW